MTTAIETTHLCKSYGRKTALKDVQLSIPKGRACALLGPNGAGKTSLIEILLNHSSASYGSSWINGTESRKLRKSDWQKLGYLPTEPDMPDWMRVRDFLHFCKQLYPTWDPALEQRLVTEFDLPLDRRMKNLSSGMQIKALLVSILSFRPDILVLDEPFARLDPVVRDDLIAGLLEVYNPSETTLLVSSHDIEEVERLCDWVIAIEDGQIVCSESVESLVGRYRWVTVGMDSNAPRDTTRFPETWFQFEQAEKRFRFIDSRFDEASCLESIHNHFGNLPIDSEPLSLRSIFVANTRNNKSKTIKTWK